MKKSLITFLTFAVVGLISPSVYGQGTGFMHASGKQILDNKGENFISRSIGTGNWFLQEGYMLQSRGVNPDVLKESQSAFRRHLELYIGKKRTEEFYEAWLDSHFRRSDLDSMKKWGFNSIRPALHCKWFTLPIEEEPIEGQHTWLEDGFNRLDSLVKWCSENEMYVFLDMHGCPGGQGRDAAISDYNEYMPSLWESELNKEKLIALWVKIAERYADCPWIAGYDFINEPNWTELYDNDGADLRDIYERLFKAVRAVDKNHMFIIEGNDWGKDYTGILPPWDDSNICYSYHKYWNNNTQESLNFITEIRDTYNVPIWQGESGENSNTWFTDAIALAEQNNIGWSWWPVKKHKVNNIFRVITPESYENLLSYWSTGQPKMTSDEVFEAVMDFAYSSLTENCVVQRDVIDAMFRQPFTNATIPYLERTDKDVLYAVDYDLGRQGYAYSDNLFVDYHASRGDWTRTWTLWNVDLKYRNDGVDINECSDPKGNGYAVCWIEDGEWLQHTINVAKSGEYKAIVRYSSQYRSYESSSLMHFEVGGKVIGSQFALPPTGGQDTWCEVEVSGIKLKKGVNSIKWVFDRGAFNLSSVEFVLVK